MRYRAVGGDDFAASAVDLLDLFAFVQGDAVVGICSPLSMICSMVFSLASTGEHNAVVIAVRFFAEYRDVVMVGGQFEQFFEGAYPAMPLPISTKFSLCIVASPERKQLIF